MCVCVMFHNYICTHLIIKVGLQTSLCFRLFLLWVWLLHLHQTATHSISFGPTGLFSHCTCDAKQSTFASSMWVSLKRYMCKRCKELQVVQRMCNDANCVIISDTLIHDPHSHDPHTRPPFQIDPGIEICFHINQWIGLDYKIKKK